MRNLKCILLSVLFLFIPMTALAGNLDSPAAPTNPGSAMFTVEDIYNRLNAGTTGTKRPGAFTEPGAGPASTGKTLDDVMGKAPVVDAAGAGLADVLTGKTFWGLKSDGWGLLTGTYSGSTGVPKTGQTPTVPLNPAPAGSDGALEEGVAWPNPRFTDNSDSTVTDNLTGLMWGQVADAGGEREWYIAAGGTYPALAYCNDLGLGGHSDWRLPNVKELGSLIDSAFVNPALSNAAGDEKWTTGDAFTGVRSVKDSDYYWSSTTAANDTRYAWVVHFYSGSVINGTKTNAYYVWPVRGGQ